MRMRAQWGRGGRDGSASEVINKVKCIHGLVSTWLGLTDACVWLEAWRWVNFIIRLRKVCVLSVEVARPERQSPQINIILQHAFVARGDAATEYGAAVDP